MTLKLFCALLSKLTGGEWKHRTWSNLLEAIGAALPVREQRGFSYWGFTGVVDLSRDKVGLTYAAQLAETRDPVRFEFWYEINGTKSEVAKVRGDHRNYASHKIELPNERGVYWVKCSAKRPKRKIDPPGAPHWIQMYDGCYRVRIA